jgi:hypothetical protein
MELTEVLRLTVEILGCVLAIAALYVGVVHLREIRPLVDKLTEQVGVAKAHTEMLKRIQNEMTTHPIGPFPDCVRPITKLIEGAESRVIILCDFPAYGSFSAPHHFLDYRHAIEQKIDEGKQVEITYLKPARRVELIREQFLNVEKDWDTWKKEQEHVREFLEAHHKDVTVEALTFKQFMDFLEEENLRTVRILEEEALKDTTDILDVEEHVPIYFWIVDNKAIFTIPVYSKAAIEYGFQTSDEDIIGGFLAIRDRYLRKASHHGLPAA